MSAESVDPSTAQLLDENKEYKKLQEEHVFLDDKVSQFTQQKFLTSQEELELAMLKKLKLAGKDRMQRIAAEQKQQGLHP